MRQARDLLYRKVHLGSNPNPGASYFSVRDRHRLIFKKQPYNHKVYGRCDMDSNTAVRNLGISLAVTGIILLVGYTFYNLLTLESNLVLKLSIAAFILGIVLTLLSLIKEKIGTKDTEIERKY